MFSIYVPDVIELIALVPTLDTLALLVLPPTLDTLAPISAAPYPRYTGPY